MKEQTMVIKVQDGNRTKSIKVNVVPKTGWKGQTSAFVYLAPEFDAWSQQLGSVSQGYKKGQWMAHHWDKVTITTSTLRKAVQDVVEAAVFSGLI